MGKYRDQFMFEMNRLLPGLLDQIEVIWMNIGVGSDECQRRTDYLIQRAGSIIEKTVKMYDDEYNKLVENIEHVGKQILALTDELGNETKQPDEQLSVLQLEEYLLNYLEELRAEKSRRLSAYETLTLEEKQLAARLEWPYPAPACGNVPTDNQLDLLSQHVAEMRMEKERRYCTFSALRGTITRLFKMLELKPATEFERHIVSNEDDFPLTMTNLDALKALKEKLEADLQAQIAESDKLREQLIMLWNRLNVPQEDKEMFLANNMGHTCSVILSIKEEIKEMEKRKMESMQTLIINLREEILIYWEKCLYSAHQKETFQHFYTETCTEEVLEEHENYLKNLKEFHSECHGIFEKVLRLRDLFQKLIVFVTKKNLNPERFNNRGGGLLKEEKERKTLQVQIPKFESEIQEAVQKWESQHSARLTVYGQSLPNFLQTQWDTYNNEKEKERLERQLKKHNLEEMSKGAGITPLLGKRSWVPSGSPLSARTNKIQKITTPRTSTASRFTPLKCVNTRSVPNKLPSVGKISLGKPPQSSSKIPSSKTSCSTPLAPLNHVHSVFMPNNAPKTCSMPLGKPPLSLKKEPITRKMQPRRLLQKAVMKTQKMTENSIITQPMLKGAEGCDVDTAQLLGSSTLSTYTEFENKLSSKCRTDINSRSSTVTPHSPIPGSPRRCRSRLGLPMLI